MDRTALSEAIVRELGELFVSELVQAGPALVRSDLDGIEQGLQALSRRVLGRVVEAVVTTIAAGQPVERPSCGACQQPMRAVDPARPRALQGLVVVLGDGADWIWRYAWQFLGRRGIEVVEIVDIFHTWGHLWTVANAVFGAGTAQAAAWAESLKGRLLDAGPAPILDALAALAPTVSGTDAAEVVRKARGYFTDHADRMAYPRFVARQLPIGSGGVESACKTLIQAREKQAGMRWSHDGAQTVASLRALHRSGRWHHFWQTHPQCRRPPIAPPRPTTSAIASSVTRAA